MPKDSLRISFTFLLVGVRNDSHEDEYISESTDASVQCRLTPYVCLRNQLREIIPLMLGGQDDRALKTSCSGE